MAISFVGSLPVVTAINGGSVTLTFSNLRDASNAAVSLAQNDVIYAAYAHTLGADGAMPTPAGWEKLCDLFIADSNVTNLAVYRKVMGASPDASVVFTGPGGTANSATGVAVALRGTDTSVSFDVAVVTATGIDTGVPNFGPVTPATAGAWILAFAANAAATGAVFTNTNLSTTTNHFRTGSASDNFDSTLGMGIKTDWTSGAFDPAFGGGTANATDSWAAVTLAVRPAGGGGPVDLAAAASQSFGALTGSASAVVAVNAASSGSFGQLGGTASGTVSVAALSSGAFGAIAGTATAKVSVAASSGGSFGALGGSATATSSMSATSSGAFGAVAGSAAGTADVRALSSGAFGLLAGSATATVQGAAASIAAFGALSGSASAVVPVRAASTASFGALGSTASGIVAVTALSAGAFGALTGSATARLLSAATSSQAFGAISGTATASGATDGLSAASNQSFGAMVGSAAGNVDARALSQGQFGALAGSATAVSELKASSASAFGELVGVATAGVANDNAPLFFAVIG